MLRSEIIGHVKMKVELSGMPNLKLGLNDKVFFEVSGSYINTYGFLTYCNNPVLPFSISSNKF